MASPNNLEIGPSYPPVRASRKEVIATINNVADLYTGIVVDLHAKPELTQDQRLLMEEYVVLIGGIKRLTGRTRLTDRTRRNRYDLSFKDPVLGKRVDISEGISITGMRHLLNGEMDDLGVRIRASGQDSKAKKALWDLFSIRYRQHQVLEAFSVPSTLSSDQKEARIRLEALQISRDGRRRADSPLGDWLKAEGLVNGFQFINLPQDEKGFADFLKSLLPAKPHMPEIRWSELELAFPSVGKDLFIPRELPISLELGKSVSGLKEWLGKGRKRVCREINNLISGGLSFSGDIYDGAYYSYEAKYAPKIERSRHNFRECLERGIDGVIGGIGLVGQSVEGGLRAITRIGRETGGVATPSLNKTRESIEKAHNCKGKRCCILLLPLIAVLAISRDSLIDNNPVLPTSKPSAVEVQTGDPSLHQTDQDGYTQLKLHWYKNLRENDSVKGNFEYEFAKFRNPNLEDLELELGESLPPEHPLIAKENKLFEAMYPELYSLMRAQYIDSINQLNPSGPVDGDKIIKPVFLSLPVGVVYNQVMQQAGLAPN